MDPLSISAAAVGFLTLAIQVSTSLSEFYSSYKHRKSEIAEVVDRITSLQQDLETINQALSERAKNPKTEKCVRSIESSTNRCTSKIQKLDKTCRKIQDVTIDSRNPFSGGSYPFKKSTLAKIEENISDIRDDISFALQALQAQDNQQIRTDNAEMKALLDLLRNHQISDATIDWLKAPDVSINHNSACSKRHHSTGLWFIDSPAFREWLSRKESFIWLYGFAGCGKSILFSTIVQRTFHHRGSNTAIGVAFFYFTFNDESKQDASAMLRAVLLQLASQSEDAKSELERFRASYRSGTPPIPILVEYLHRFVQMFKDVYVLLDALDESPQAKGHRGELLDVIDNIRLSHEPKLHLLITSRDLPDIRDALQVLSTEAVEMRNVSIDKDISDYIVSRLGKDRRLRHWRSYSQKIHEKLSRRAEGVFRYVDCQLTVLEKCPSSQYHLDRMLNSLPEDLDETYRRILENIEPSLREDARRILLLLCFAVRPLTIEELIDGLAVEIDDPPRFNPQHRLENNDDLRRICPGLIEIGSAYPDDDQSEDKDIPDEGSERNQSDPEKYSFVSRTGDDIVVRIAHFSVQEYLKSDRITGHNEYFSLNCGIEHTELTQIYLTYLMETTISLPDLSSEVIRRYPLTDLAAKYWWYHLKLSGVEGHVLDDMVLELFSGGLSFNNWARMTEALFRFDVPRDGKYPDDVPVAILFGSAETDVGGPLYYTCLLGLDRLFRLLTGIDNQPLGKPYYNQSDSTESLANLVNRSGGQYGSPLHVASFAGHLQLVEELLRIGANVNMHCGDHVTALQAAASGGHYSVVFRLLQEDADVNAIGGRYQTALQAACFYGHLSIVELLLDRNADVSVEGGICGTALAAAAEGDHLDIIKLLLNKGVDVNAMGGYYSTALASASSMGRLEAMKLLLNEGADVNAGGGPYSTALASASDWGRLEAMKLLLNEGADVNADGGLHGTALASASRHGNVETIKLLLNEGADVNAIGGYYGTSLASASASGEVEAMKLLLKKGADVNAIGGQYGTALTAATQRGDLEAMELLLNNGAKVNAVAGCYGTALASASSMGFVEAMELLLEYGADVNVVAECHRTALREAVRVNERPAVELLLRNGAGVNATTTTTTTTTATEGDGQVRGCTEEPCKFREPDMAESDYGFCEYTELEIALALYDPGVAVSLLRHGGKLRPKPEISRELRYVKEEVHWKEFLDLLEQTAWYQEQKNQFEATDLPLEDEEDVEEEEIYNRIRKLWRPPFETANPYQTRKMNFDMALRTKKFSD